MISAEGAWIVAAFPATARRCVQTAHVYLVQDAPIEDTLCYSPIILARSFHIVEMPRPWSASPSPQAGAPLYIDS